MQRDLTPDLEGDEMADEQRHVSRRALTRGAAWATPAVVVATAAPAAASPCRDTGLQPFPQNGTSGNGWTITSTGATTSGTATFDPSDGSSTAGSLYVDADPADGVSYEAVARSSATFVPGQTCRLSFTYNIPSGPTLPMTGFVRVGGTTVPGSAITTDRSGSTGLRVSTTFTMPSPAPATFDVVFQVSSPAGSGTVGGDDIRIYNVALTCG